MPVSNYCRHSSQNPRFDVINSSSMLFALDVPGFLRSLGCSMRNRIKLLLLAAAGMIASAWLADGGRCSARLGRRSCVAADQQLLPDGGGRRPRPHFHQPGQQQPERHPGDRPHRPGRHHHHRPDRRYGHRAFPRWLHPLCRPQQRNAVTAISTATLTQTASYPLPAGDSPVYVAVQSGKVWVATTPERSTRRPSATSTHRQPSRHCRRRPT